MKYFLMCVLLIIGCSHECKSWSVIYPKDYKFPTSYWSVCGKKFESKLEAEEYARELVRSTGKPAIVKQYDPTPDDKY